MRYIIITGEVSGDRIGAAVVGSLKHLDPHGQFFALGGTELHAAGAEIIRDITDLSIMGFSNPLKKVLRIWQLYGFIKSKIQSINPDAIIYIDSAGFNLRLGKWTNAQGYTNVYIAPPKTWASRPRRNSDLQKYFDQIFTLFPFAQKYFKQHQISSEFLGHPLMEGLKKKSTDKAINKVLVAPGSRLQEIQAIMPVLWQFIESEHQYEFIVSKMSHIDSSHYSIARPHSCNIRFSEESLTVLLSQVDFAIITSGTATLEAAMMDIPQVIIYKTSWFNYIIAKRLITTKYIGLPNLILNAQIIPELIQKELTSDNLIDTVGKVMHDLNRIKKNYDHIRVIYTGNNSANLIAEKIIHSLSNSNHLPIY